MDWGMCGGEGGASCSSFAEGLGSFVMIALMMSLLVAVFVFIGRLIYIVGTYKRRDKWDTRSEVVQMIRDTGVLGEYGYKQNPEWISDLYDKLDAEDRCRRSKAAETTKD